MAGWHKFACTNVTRKKEKEKRSRNLNSCCYHACVISFGYYLDVISYRGNKKSVEKHPLFWSSCSYLKNEVGGPHFLWLENNQHVALKLSANFKKIPGSGFRATLIFRNIKVALNLLPRIFLKFAASLTVIC